MGDKSPKSIGKNKKQKGIKKDNASRKAMAEVEAKKEKSVKPKRK